ncbi:MAG TPA: M1 family metallopeptidase [Bacteroidota bacterium]|nr:M1 family metallopeptidase [Bacteroidota bacterium]
MIARFIIAMLFLPVFAGVLYSRQTISSSPLSPRIANYQISVSLDVEAKSLNAKQTLVWRNTSPDRISELQFHLYLNAFKDLESTFMKESGGALRGISMAGGGWGWIEVNEMRVRGGEDLHAKIEFISPDDGNPNDRTVFRVPLSRPILPGQSITVDLQFTAKLPRVFARTGYYEDFFMVAQWFPKIGVYEPAGMRYAKRGGWNCHQFHANTEFYADYGVYEVDMTLPEDYIVGATGVLKREVRNPDGTKTMFYRAEDVHDFAWTAYPRFTVVEDQWKHVNIRLLLSPGRTQHTERYLTSTKAALTYFDQHVGAYPYTTLTVVDPPNGAGGAGGMEYPTLITGGSSWGLPDGLRFIELVTIHEFGHQYFYGLIGTNEFEEAWMDEGFNSYYEVRIMDEVYGKKTSALDVFGFHMGDLELARSTYTGMMNPKIAPIFSNAWEFKAGGYSSLTYSKTATFMVTLERMIGRSVMDEIMRTYFNRWKFKHPCARDFQAIVNEVVRQHHGSKFGANLDWFFEQVLYGTNVCDYELTSISNRQVFREEEESSDSAGTSEEQRAEYESRVLVSRLGEIIMPVDVLVRFDNGKEIRERWTGRERWKEFVYEGAEQIVWAKVDPDEVLMIDINLLNNSKTNDPLRSPIWRYTLKFLFWLQNILQFGLVF